MARRAKIRVKWRNGAFADLRTLPAAMDELDGHAERIASAAGDGYEVKGPAVASGRGRGRAAIVTTTTAAMRDNAKNHTLMRALGGGKG